MKKDKNKSKKTETKEIKKDKNLLKIEELEKQLEESKNDYLRVLADFQNFRNRNQKEMINSKDNAISDFVSDILPAIDNFEMSLKQTENTNMFVKGVEMIHKNLIETLKEHKITSFNPKIGEKFNPYLHEPILIENNDYESGEIVNILKKGFKFKDKIIRPARVQVVKEEVKNINK